MSQITVLKVGGMSCDACVRHVTRALEGMRGVTHVEVSLTKAEASVEHEPDRVDAHALRAAIRDAGYDAVAVTPRCCCSASQGESLR